MRFFERIKTATVERISEAFRIKIPYEDYLKMDDALRKRFNLIGHFDEAERAWLVDEDDIRQALDVLFKAGFHISIIGESKRIREEIAEKIKRAEEWLRAIKKHPSLCFLKPIHIKKLTDGSYSFAKKGEGKKIWCFKYEETPQDVLDAAKKLTVTSSKGKRYTLFLPTKKALSLLKTKHKNMLTEKVKKEKFRTVQFIDYQRRLLQDPLKVSYSPQTITQ